MYDLPGCSHTHLKDLDKQGNMSSNVQNRAFEIIETLQEIFMYLAEDPPDVENSIIEKNRSTLLNAALCCKIFLQPALNAFWWSIDDIFNLFLLLPAFKESESGIYVQLAPSTISFHTLILLFSDS